MWISRKKLPLHHENARERGERSKWLGFVLRFMFFVFIIPLVAVWSAQVFFYLTPMHRQLAFTHRSKASLLQVHPDRVDDWGKTRSSQIWSSIFLFFLTLWRKKINIQMRNSLIIYTQLIDGTFASNKSVCPWCRSSVWGVFEAK